MLDVVEIAIGVALGMALYNAFTRPITFKGMLRAALFVVAVPLLAFGGLWALSVLLFRPRLWRPGQLAGAWQ